VHKHFDYINIEGARKLIAVCKCCNKYRKAKNTCRQRVHLLEECTKYHQIVEEKARIQTHLPTLPRIDEARKVRIDQKFALAIYTTGRSFSTFEDATWLDFFKEFNYTPPTRSAISSGLLNTTYDKLKDEVDAVIDNSPSLSLVTDESGDVSLNRLANYSVLTPDGQSFYYKTVDVKDKTQNAENVVEDIVEVAKEISKGLLRKFVSLAMDTCPRNIKAFEILSDRPETQHMFMVPCESHGLQLLIKDLLEKPPLINAVWKKASLLVNALRNAPKQYAYLRIQQEQIYGEMKALIAAGFTRWGTQYRLVKSVDDSKQALRQLAINDDPEIEFKYADIVLDQQFWIQLADLLLILEPLHTLQKMSEDNRASLSFVYERWTTIHTKLSTIAASTNSFAPEIKSFMTEQDGKLWKDRFNRQLTPLHTTAFFLNPKNFDYKMDEQIQKQIINTFNRFIPASHIALQHFYDFRRRRGAFYPTSQAWSFQGNPKLFWAYIETTCPELSSFADKLMITCANSVPSERAWSSMNYIHSKTRNSLSFNTVDKLQFIYINYRILRKVHKLEPTKEELLAMEDSLMGAKWVE
jgi:hypothetical protein